MPSQIERITKLEVKVKDLEEELQECEKATESNTDFRKFVHSVKIVLWAIGAAIIWLLGQVHIFN